MGRYLNLVKKMTVNHLNEGSNPSLPSKYERVDRSTYTQEVQLDLGDLVLIRGDSIKYWISGGPADFDGSFDAFAKRFPVVMHELVRLGFFQFQLKQPL